jgi:hypothetical protein
MDQLTQLAADHHRQRLAYAEAQRPAERLLALAGPPAAPSAPNGGCAAPSARPGGCADSSRPRPPAISDHPPVTTRNLNPTTTKEVTMNPTRRPGPIRRLASALAALAAALLAAAAAAPAAFAARTVPSGPPPAAAGLHEPPGWSNHPPLPGQAAAAVAEHHESPTGALPAAAAAPLHQLAHRAPGPVPVHTVVGGMPGWQIALIAAGAALLAATVAVLADRARTARRQAATPAA